MATSHLIVLVILWNAFSPTAEGPS